MSWEGWFTLAVVATIFVGLARGLAPPDVLLVGGAVLVTLAGVITRQDLFAGLSNEGMLTVAALFVVAAGLRETGALDAIGGRILGQAGNDRIAVLRMAPPVLAMSAFLNNTPVVAMLITVISDWCRRRGLSPSKLLMPLSYLAILGGTCTLIGTSTNLVVNGMMIDQAKAIERQASAEREPEVRDSLLARQEQLRGMSMFEMSRVGIPLALIGVAYLVLVARKLLPDRKDLLEHVWDSPREYLVDMVIQPGCRLAGQRVEEAGLRHLPGLFLVEVTRDERLVTPVAPDFVLQVGDHLTFSGVVSTIVDLERIPGLVPATDDAYEAKAARRRQHRLCEAVISATSPLVGQTIRDADFRALYGAAVVAAHRGGTRLAGRIGDIHLRAGDTLLLQTTTHFVRAHRNNPDFMLVSGIEESRPVRHDRAPLSLLLLLVLIVLMTSGWLSAVMAAFLVAGLMLVTRCISASVARQSVDWQVLLTITGALALATALAKTGAAAAIAHGIVGLTHTLGPRGTLLAVYVITVFFTELITNNAAAALMFPLAVAVAGDFDVSPRPFIMAVAFAASASFVTPIGYQTNMMVFGPGGYRFSDFLRVGLPLSLIVCLVATALIPCMWPF